MKDLFGNGIFNTDGAAWTMQRKAASLSFRLSDIKRSVHVFSACADDAVTLLESQAGKPVDFQTLMQNLTLAAFTELSFGRRLATVSLEESEFGNHFKVGVSSFP